MNRHRKSVLAFIFKELIKFKFELVYLYFINRFSKNKYRINQTRLNLKLLVKQNNQFYQTDFGVVIPVFEIKEELIKTLKILKSNYPNVKVLIIDDSIKQNIDLSINQSNQVNIIKNGKNLGYTYSINEGISRLLDKKYVATINSDVVIHKETLIRMFNKFQLNRKIASVTAIGEDDFGQIGLYIPKELDSNVNSIQDALDAHFFDSEVKGFIFPTSIGHMCMYSVRSLKTVGLFDTEKYPTGYGEENDWSIRALRLGYRHYLALDIFVQHAQGSSFGHRKIIFRSKANDRRYIDYPIYDRIIGSQIYVYDYIKKLNFRILLTLLKHSRKNLFISHGFGGGATQLENELDNSLCQQALFQDFTLARFHLVASHIEMSKFRLELRIANAKIVLENLNFFEAFEYLETVHFDQIYLGALSGIEGRQFLTIENLFTIYNWLKIGKYKTDFIVHDYYSICPSYTLIDYVGKFCGVPDIDFCQRCISKNIFAVKPNDFIDINVWRNFFFDLFMLNSVRIIVWSESSRILLLRAFELNEFGKIRIISPTKYKNEIVTNKFIRIAFVGALSYAKGATVSIFIAKEMNSYSNSYKFHHFGESAYSDPNVIKYHGKYERDDLPKLLKEFEIDFLIIPSIWPETYAQIADEVEVLGIKIICLKIGAIFDRFANNSNFIFLDDFSIESLAKFDSLLLLDARN